MEITPGEIARAVEKTPTANIAIISVLFAFCSMGYLVVHMLDGIGAKVSEATKGAAELKASMDGLTAELHSGRICRQISASDPLPHRSGPNKPESPHSAPRQMTEAD